MNRVQTYTGYWVDPLNVKPEQICIEDIAHSLSLQCRFNGHCLRFYSVADHSVRVAWALPDGLNQWGLLHDAAETYLPDIPRPIKRIIPKYAELEEKLLQVIAKRFDLSWPMPKEVKLADDRMLTAERRDILIPTKHKWTDRAEPLPGKIVPLSAKASEEMFLGMAKAFLTV